MRVIADIQATFSQLWLPINKSLIIFISGATWALFYLPVITSYDYDAPLSESGDPNEKYYNTRDVVTKYLPEPPGPVPPPLPKYEYGRVYLEKVYLPGFVILQLCLHHRHFVVMSKLLL